MGLVLFVRVMQGLCAACWLIPFMVCWRSLWRVLLGRARGDDPIWVVVWFMSCSQLGFIVRWFLFGTVIPQMSVPELQLWAGMYFLSAVVALATMWVVRRSEASR